ncbi:MAG: excinuclease ABC subunit UvrA [Planctomycetaceae bacterium]|jgi:excinuclease ABC subunit A|nr:excinuclease ABC subunit UvrA [Planctomycetaceae bacterium]
MIKLRKVYVHNLNGIDLDLPTGKLIVICGRSGSGKSSLAIDTLYAEGQRRYIETFSARTRQFLEKFEKPDALQIDGLPVSVAVTGKIDPNINRGTVGNVTGITDYLRLLFAKIGRPFCPSCNAEIEINSPEKILHKLPTIIESLNPNREKSESRIIETKIQIAFEPNILPDRNEFIKTWRERGFVRCIIFNKTLRIDESEISADLYEQLLQNANLNKVNHKVQSKVKTDNRESPILIVVDRFTSRDIERLRFLDSVRTAYRYGGDKCCLTFHVLGKMIQYHFAQQLFCANCNLSFPSLEPQLFNPDSPLGACPSCCGGIISGKGYYGKIARGVDFVLNAKNTKSIKCECGGSRLRAESRAVKIDGRNIIELCDLPADILRNEIVQTRSKLPDYERMISDEAFDQILSRLSYLGDVGLSYLSASRLAGELSGGECRRVYLTGALGSSLVEIMYVLDEPSVGLHPQDSNRLLKLIYKLRDNGNTIIVVEHEEIFLRGADLLVEIGPGAGEAGGNVIFQGTPEEMLVSDQSLTGKYLRTIQNHADNSDDSDNSSDESFSYKKEKASDELRFCSCDKLKKSKSNLRQVVRGSTGRIRISGCCGHNLRGITAMFPLGQLCVVAGVSGAGKSTLVFDTLYPAACKLIGKKSKFELSGGIIDGKQYEDASLSGLINDVASVTREVNLSASRLGSSRSNPATYLKIFDGIREIFASTAEARLRNYNAGRFSFNVAGGRCENCLGEGFILVDMQFMSDMYIRCPECRGSRYRSDTLEILYRGKNIAEILEMTAREAFLFFRGQVKLQRRLKRMIDVGLDYIRIGQRLNTLSSGELQRLRLASYLMQTRGGGCLLLFDEPTTGLHFADIEQLLICFDMLQSMGHSLIVIEHNLQLIEHADHIIEIGPGASNQGGKIIAEGTPKEISENPNSIIGKFL